jgi:hypothetical protein
MAKAARIAAQLTSTTRMLVKTGDAKKYPNKTIAPVAMAITVEKVPLKLNFTGHLPS